MRAPCFLQWGQLGQLRRLRLQMLLGWSLEFGLLQVQQQGQVLQVQQQGQELQVQQQGQVLQVQQQGQELQVQQQGQVLMQIVT
jgi:hypothetical protein